MTELPTLPFAVYDEFGRGADDRVQDYGRACWQAALASRDAEVEAIHCEKCRELLSKAAEVVSQTHLAGLNGHTKSAACIHRKDDPQGCYRVRCQLGKSCAAIDQEQGT